MATPYGLLPTPMVPVTTAAPAGWTATRETAIAGTPSSTVVETRIATRRDRHDPWERPRRPGHPDGVLILCLPCRVQPATGRVDEHAEPHRDRPARSVSVYTLNVSRMRGTSAALKKA